MNTRKHLEDEVRRLAKLAGEPETETELIDLIDELAGEYYERGVQDGYSDGSEY